METYIYFNPHDPSSEPISKTKANSVHEAAEKFAAIKKLTLDEFTSIFNVELHGEKTNKTSV